MPADRLILRVAGTDWEGWQRVSVTRSVEQVPSSFEIEVTERYPTGGQISIKPGDPCQVLLGGAVVLTGWIARSAATINPTAHDVRISGRSKSSDLVDCSAFVGSQDSPQYQIKSAPAVEVIRQLAGAYKVDVQAKAGNGPTLNNFRIAPGETPWELIDRITRYSKMLAYDAADGSLILAQAGQESQASGFKQAINVESASINWTMDQRFSEYEGFLIATQVLSDGSGRPGPRGEIERDEAVPRYRKRIIISEQTDLGKSLVHDRIVWEKNRRAGRSIAVTVTADSWRDTGGNLWEPNKQAEVDIPAVKTPGGKLTIASVFPRSNKSNSSTWSTVGSPALSSEPFLAILSF